MPYSFKHCEIPFKLHLMAMIFVPNVMLITLELEAGGYGYGYGGSGSGYGGGYSSGAAAPAGYAGAVGVARAAYGKHLSC